MIFHLSKNIIKACITFLMNQKVTKKIAHSLFSESNSWANGYGQESMDKRLKVDLQNP